MNLMPQGPALIEFWPQRNLRHDSFDFFLIGRDIDQTKRYQGLVSWFEVKEGVQVDPSIRLDGRSDSVRALNDFMDRLWKEGLRPSSAVEDRSNMIKALEAHIETLKKQVEDKDVQIKNCVEALTALSLPMDQEMSERAEASIRRIKDILNNWGQKDPDPSNEQLEDKR